MQYRLKIILVLVLFAMGLTPVDAKKPKKSKRAAVTLTQEQRIGRDEARKYSYFYQEAMRQHLMENYSNAFELLSHCIEIDPDAPEAHYQIGRYFLAMGQDSLAQKHYERAVDLEPHNSDFLEILGNLYYKKGDSKSATDLYERVYAQFPDRTELLGILMQAYENQRDYDNLLRTLERYEVAEGTSDEITLSKMHIYTLKGDDEGAYNVLNRLVESHPNDLNYKVMLGNWMLGHNNKEGALQAFLSVLSEEPDHAQAQLSLMDYYRADNKSELADSLLYAVLENPKTEPRQRISMMRQVIADNERNGGDSTRILSILQRVLTLPQKTSEMAMIQAAYMEMKNMPKDSLKNALLRVLEISPEEVGIRLKYIAILWEEGIDDRVIEECRKAIDYCPKETTLYYYLGLALYINEREEEAIKAFLDGIEVIDNQTPKDMCAKIYMLLGDTYHHIDKKDEAYAAYDKCLEYNPNEISCLNNYAYFLSLDEKDLKRAEEMSHKTITAEPRNTTYLDTYAWILYKQERYEEAKIYIDLTLKYDEEANDVSADVLEHAGDIYIKTGNRTKALEFYQQALDKGSDNEAELKQKINKAKR